MNPGEFKPPTNAAEAKVLGHQMTLRIAEQMQRLMQMAGIANRVTGTAIHCSSASHNPLFTADEQPDPKVMGEQQVIGVILAGKYTDDDVTRFLKHVSAFFQDELSVGKVTTLKRNIPGMPDVGLGEEGGAS